MDRTGEQRAAATPSVISRSALDELISELASRGFTVIGPTVRDRAILYEEISSTADLPEGLAKFDSSGIVARSWLKLVSFPLTLTLSLREREQRASRSGKPTDLDCTPRREGFTLSPRERAGVRGKKPRDREARMSSPCRAANARTAIWL